MKEKILFTLYSLIFGILNSQDIKPEDTEIWDPEPKIVSPGASFRDAPSDAIVLFSGLNLNKWVHKNGEPARWDVKDGYFTVKPGSGSILSKDFFGSCQLHVEFMSPIDIEGDGQNAQVYLAGTTGNYISHLADLQFFSLSRTTMSIKGSTGNVGIGDHPSGWSPASLLHLYKKDADGGTLLTIEADGGSAEQPYTGIVFKTNDGNPSPPKSGTNASYISSTIESGWTQGESAWNQSWIQFKTFVPFS